MGGSHSRSTEGIDGAGTNVNRVAFPPVFRLQVVAEGWPNRGPDEAAKGMKGSVTTFPLNALDVSRMLEGELLPRAPAILASVIGISFIGLGVVPKDLLKGNFRVHRQWVREALAWLVRNNQFYFGLKVSERALDALPEDDVPEELVAIIRQESSVDLAVKESAGYVPDEDSEEEDCEDNENVAQRALGAYADKEGPFINIINILIILV